MALRILAALAACLALGGCDFVSAARDEAGAEGPSAARPEGWESLEGEGATLRLYYQFVDERRQVRFVERLEDVPEAWRAMVGFVKMSAPPPLSPGDAARERAVGSCKPGLRDRPGRAYSASTGPRISEALKK